MNLDFHYCAVKTVARAAGAGEDQAQRIDHMMIAHVPDLSHLSFEMRYTDDNGKSKNYSRDNTETFVSAGKELYGYIRECLDGTAKADMEWAALEGKLKEAFLTDISVELESGEQEAMKKLAGIWKRIFPGL